MKIKLLFILLILSGCSYEEFDYSDINKIDNLIVESRFSVELIDSIYNNYEENDYLNGLRDIVYLYNNGKDTGNNHLFHAPNEDDGTFVITSICFSHYFLVVYRLNSVTSINQSGDKEVSFIGKYSTFLGVDVDQSTFYTLNHFIPNALDLDTHSRNIWVRICLSKYLQLHQYNEMSLDYLLEAEQINKDNLYVKELLIRNYLALKVTSNLSEYVNEFPDNYAFIDLDKEEVKKLNSIFPAKKFKSNPIY